MILSRVKITNNKKLNTYRKIISPSLFKQIKQRAKALVGLRVLHLNATNQGGGVAEILQGLVPLMNDLKLNARWYTIKPINPKFFTITKKIHNALQGKKINLTKQEKQIYLQTNQQLAEQLKKLKNDVLVIHDPQPLATLSFWPNHPPAIWRCHIDTTNPYPPVWRFLSPYLSNYQQFIFHMKEFIPTDLKRKKAIICPPAIDPLTIKNKLLSKRKATQIVAQFGIDLEKPLVTQVSRFDPWKDPLGVIKAYRLAKQKIPNLQLAYLGLSLAKDDPESLEIYQTVKKAIRPDDRIFLFFNPKQINLPVDLFVNAFQTGSDVILQKSIREGFGLSVTEAMWKGTPVIGGRVGGIKKQIKHGFNGFLVNDIKSTANDIVLLIRNKKLAHQMGRRAKQSVRQNFLLPRLLNDYLKLFSE